MKKRVSPWLLPGASKEAQADMDAVIKAECRGERFVPDKRCGKDYEAKTFRVCVDPGWLQSITDLTPAERGYALQKFIAEQASA